MALELARDYRLRWMDFDRHGRLQPFAVLDIFQDVATMHANQIRMSRDEMLAQGVFWVVARQKLEFVREPGHFQEVTARTWPHSPSRFSFCRDYQMCDKQGNVLVNGTSEWVLVDVEERKFVSMKDHYHGPTDFSEERNFPKKPRKISVFDEGNRPPVVITPAFSDIDLNGHVNNARYASYVLNALDPDAGTAVKTLQIDYRHEAFPGQPLTVHTLVEDGMVRQKAVREDGDISFAAAIELR